MRPLPASRWTFAQSSFSGYGPGPSLGCFVATLVLLQCTGSNAPVPIGYFTWPDNLSEIQVVTSAGSRTVKLMRNTMPAQSAGGWTVSDVKIAQAGSADGQISTCQIHLTVTNSTGHTYYVSAFDFSVIDAKGRRWSLEPARMLRLDQGISGRWMNEGDRWSGWLLFPRRDAPITGVVFEPDRFTHIALNALD